jgi:hypothetical protein
MANEAMLNAAITQLRAKALEAYAVIKDTLHTPLEEGDLNTLATQAIKLAQYEGAMITLQQYSKELLIRSEAEEPEEEEPESEEIPLSPVIQLSEEELISKSPTYKQSLEDAKLKGLNKKKGDE